MRRPIREKIGTVMQKSRSIWDRVKISYYAKLKPAIVKAGRHLANAWYYGWSKYHGFRRARAERAIKSILEEEGLRKRGRYKYEGQTSKEYADLKKELARIDALLIQLDRRRFEANKNQNISLAKRTITRMLLAKEIYAARKRRRELMAMMQALEEQLTGQKYNLTDLDVKRHMHQQRERYYRKKLAERGVQIKKPQTQN